MVHLCKRNYVMKRVYTLCIVLLCMPLRARKIKFTYLFICLNDFIFSYCEVRVGVE